MNHFGRKPKIGLARQEAEEAFREFLDPKNEAKVFALKGDWGIGKTYLLKSFLSKTGKEYYYSSAFGISSVNELKMQLWCNFRHPNQEKRGRLSRFKLRKWVKPTLESSQDIGSLVGAIPNMGVYGTGFTPAILSLTSNIIINNSFGNKLIWIDDIERKSSSFPLKELLGFIEGLAEGKGCKVILVYNENEIYKDKETKKVIEKYREKVIDYEISLNPSPIENFRIGFGYEDPYENIILDYLDREYIRTNNIRIFKKLKWTLDKVKPYINSFLPEVKRKIVHGVLFIVLAKFDKNFLVNLEALKPIRSFEELLSDEDEELRAVYLLAFQIGFSQSVISDEVISLVETSICDYQKIYEEGVRLNDRERNHQIREKLNKACEPYATSFGNSEQELCRNLVGFLNQYSPYLDFQEFQNFSAIASAIDLDLNPYKQSWIKYRIQNAETFKELYDLRAIAQNNQDLLNEHLMFILDKRIMFFEREMSIDTVLLKIVETDDWAKRDIDYLNERSVEEWQKWLSEEHPKKVNMIRKSLKLGEDFSRSLRRAIAILAKTSKLNATRAENIYQVTPEDIDTSKT
jgi:hypothetical protein